MAGPFANFVWVGTKCFNRLAKWQQTLDCIFRKGLAFVVNAYECKGKAFWHAVKKNVHDYLDMSHIYMDNISLYVHLFSKAVAFIVI